MINMMLSLQTSEGEISDTLKRPLHKNGGFTWEAERWLVAVDSGLKKNKSKAGSTLDQDKAGWKAGLLSSSERELTNECCWPDNHKINHNHGQRSQGN